MIIYSKSNLNLNTAACKLETPIKMIIEHESDMLSKKNGLAKELFNIEKSSRFGETITLENEFDTFRAVAEGGKAENDCIDILRTKFIEHIQFMKEFTVTAEMMEDATFGIAQDAKRRAEAFTRAYHKTMNSICEAALINGTSASAYFSGANLDLTTPDGKPLFTNYHPVGRDSEATNQSNYFWGDIFSSGTGSERAPSTAVFEEALSELSVKLRTMQDENGKPLGYNADTIILPGNRPIAETIARKVCGTRGALGSNFNDVNLHYGAFKIFILPNWRTDDDRVMIMSSEANKNLGGNMFFNRVPLTVTNWVDNHTGNYIWNGRCRFGVGFGSYKHILLAVDSSSSVSGSTKL